LISKYFVCKTETLNLEFQRNDVESTAYSSDNIRYHDLSVSVHASSSSCKEFGSIALSRRKGKEHQRICDDLLQRSGDSLKCIGVPAADAAAGICSSGKRAPCPGYQRNSGFIRPVFFGGFSPAFHGCVADLASNTFLLP